MSFEDISGFDQVVKTRLAVAAEQLTQEFDGIYDYDQVWAMVEESAQQMQSGSVHAFVPVLAKRFARERLRAQAQTSGRIAKPVAEVLFVSVTGSGRAQIGAALLARGGPLASVHSAGSTAVADIDPNVRKAMEEIGVDLTDAFTRPITPEVLAAADVVVTMARSVGRVEIPATTRHVDWRVGDPAGAPFAEVRRVRDDIQRRVDALAGELRASLGRSADHGT
jgi:protein-tyrosine-phosphatase